MGMRRRTRRRALVAGAAIGHHEAKKHADRAAGRLRAGRYQKSSREQPAQSAAPPPPDPAAEIEHFTQLHDSGALTDEEFAAAKAKVLGT